MTEKEEVKEELGDKPFLSVLTPYKPSQDDTGTTPLTLVFIQRHTNRQRMRAQLAMC